MSRLHPCGLRLYEDCRCTRGALSAGGNNFIVYESMNACFRSHDCFFLGRVLARKNIKAAFESLDVKRTIFAKLDAVCKPTAFVCTNTSVSGSLRER